MATTRAHNFIERAKVTELKSKLEQIGLPSIGLKSALKTRLLEVLPALSVEEMETYFPQNINEILEASCEEDEDSANPETDTVNNGMSEVEKLRRQIKQLEEVVLLKSRLAELTSSGESTSNPQSFVLRDVEDSFATFSGDDNYCFKKWLLQFEESADLLCWDQRTRLIYAKKLMRGTARLFLRTTSFKSWEDLKYALSREFCKKVSNAEIHNVLRNRRKKKEETTIQYVFAMQEISSLSDIEEADLVNYIINGIQDSHVNKLLLYSASNIEELKRALRKYDVIKQSMSTSNVAGTAIQAVPSKGPKQHVRDRIGRCFNCYETGHIANKCPKPKRGRGTCFRCGQYGHTVNTCPQTAQLNQTAVLHPSAAQSSAIMVVQGASVPESKNGSCGSNTQEFLNFSNEFCHSFSFVFSHEAAKSIMSTLNLEAIVDTGSPISFIQEKYVLPCFVKAADANGTLLYQGINNSKLNVLGRSHCSVDVLGNFIEVDLFVVKNETMAYPIVLGRDFLMKSNASLIVNPDKSSKKCSNDDFIQLDKNNLSSSDYLCAVNDILNIDACLPDDDDIAINMNEKLTHKQRDKLKQILKERDIDHDLICDDFDDSFQMQIAVSDKSSVFHCAPRRLPFAHKEELKKILNDLLERKIIRESNSPFASPIVLVKKKSGDLRLCVDYRQLNKITLKDNYPLPLIEDHLDRLRGKRYFSLLDLKNGFHHIKMAEESVKFTSFVTPLGQYEYIRMPFGLKNAPAVFQRYINTIFKSLVDDGKLLIYIDDLLIASETIEEHFVILEEVMKVVKTYKLKLRYDKCKFLVEEITYLGYKVNGVGIAKFRRYNSGQDFPIHKTVKDLHSFLGLCSYFRKFIKDFAIISKPLYDLLKQNKEFSFGINELEVFEHLKERLIQAPVLSIYNPSAETELHCDASSLGFGAVLMQKGDDKHYHPVFFFSKRATAAESKYHSYELETLAIIYALRRFRVYLLGIKFKILTDCKSLTLTLSKKILNPRISRWALELQDFEYHIEHRDGSRMGHVDALSRSHNVLLIESDSFENALAVAQNRDPVIKKIVEMLERQESPSYDMINGLVYRKLDGKAFFYVPSQMERNVIQTHHDALCHVGVDKCYDFLRKTYWFPFMKRKIKEYISNCLKCVHFSPNVGKKEGTLHSIPKGDKPFEIIHVDHYGPLPKSLRNSYRHIFLIVDGFTKYSKLYPVKSTASKEVIRCLQSYFSAYSKPSKLISDRGSCFTSGEFKEFCEENNIQHIKVATGSPQSNGQVERVNRVLTPMLSKECETDPGEWSKYLNKVEFGINNTFNRSTGESPSMLLFGVSQKGVVSDKIREYLEDNISDEKSADLQSLRRVASENIIRAQNSNKINFDKKHKRPEQYKVGDYVMIKNVVTLPGVNKKLLAKYKGPYEVVKVYPNDRYLIKDIENLQISRVPYTGTVSPENMKLYANNG